VSVPWDDLDDGIAGAVRAFVDAGFRTIDSGDGKSKGAIGWDPDAYYDVPHVVMDTTPETAIADASRILELLEQWGLDDSQVTIETYRNDEDREIKHILFVSGDDMYGWSMGDKPISMPFQPGPAEA
jgi:hypothetical protein